LIISIISLHAVLSLGYFVCEIFRIALVYNAHFHVPHEGQQIFINIPRSYSIQQILTPSLRKSRRSLVRTLFQESYRKVLSISLNSAAFLIFNVCLL